MSFLDDGGIARLQALAAELEIIGDRFEIGEPIGEGGMGEVFQAWDRAASRRVALKILREQNDQANARFEREAIALADLSHPGIVGYVAHGSTALGEPYLAMELLVGGTLAARLAEGALSVEDTIALGGQIAAALAAAHQRGIVHRDIKPSNIFLEGRSVSRVKLLDFGLARGPNTPRITQAGSLVGTPSYMAPEQVRGAPRIDARADLFALGAVLFECLTGSEAFSGEDTEAVLTRILLEQPESVQARCPGVPPALSALIARMLRKDPEGRPEGAAEVARELGALGATRPTDPDPGERAPDPPRIPLSPGALIAGKYRVERMLGRGGMGVVVLARHEQLDRRVAIKFVRRAHQTEEDAARLLREARAASRLESEHVARVLDVGVLDDGAPFIVMEFLSGADLGRVVRARGRLPVSVAIDYLLQASEALAEAHALGIVHRDLKPSNLFLAARMDGSALIKVLDFGISKITPRPDARKSEVSLTEPTAIMGSPLYMSPEQLQSSKHVDARTDLWALGVVLHELLTGRPPFEAESPVAMGAKIAAGAPRRLSEGCPEAPEGLEAVLLRCLEKDPARRFQDIAELAQAWLPYAPEASRISVERITRVTRAGVVSDDALPLPAVVPGSVTTARSWVAHRAPSRRRVGLLLVGASALSISAAIPLLQRARSPAASPAATASAPPLAASLPADPGADPSAPVDASAALVRVPTAALSSGRRPPHPPRPPHAPPAPPSGAAPVRPRPEAVVDPMDPALLSR